MIDGMSNDEVAEVGTADGVAVEDEATREDDDGSASQLPNPG